METVPRKGKSFHVRLAVNVDNEFFVAQLTEVPEELRDIFPNAAALCTKGVPSVYADAHRIPAS